MGLLLPKHQTLLLFLRGIWLRKWRDGFANLSGNHASRKQSKKSCDILLLFDDNGSAKQWFPNKHGDSRHPVLRCCWYGAGLFWPPTMSVQHSRRRGGAGQELHDEAVGDGPRLASFRGLVALAIQLGSVAAAALATASSPIAFRTR
jgi:hypothetical protein